MSIKCESKQLRSFLTVLILSLSIQEEVHKCFYHKIPITVDKLFNSYEIDLITESNTLSLLNEPIPVIKRDSNLFTLEEENKKKKKSNNIFTQSIINKRALKRPFRTNQIKTKRSKLDF